MARIFLHDCLRLISFSKGVFVVLNKYISQLKTFVASSSNDMKRCEICNAESIKGAVMQSQKM